MLRRLCLAFGGWRTAGPPVAMTAEAASAALLLAYSVTADRDSGA